MTENNGATSDADRIAALEELKDGVTNLLGTLHAQVAGTDAQWTANRIHNKLKRALPILAELGVVSTPAERSGGHDKPDLPEDPADGGEG